VSKAGQIIWAIGKEEHGFLLGVAHPVDARAWLWQYCLGNFAHGNFLHFCRMRVRYNLNRMLKPLIGYEIAKVEFGRELWPDVKTVLAAGEINTVFDVGANEGQSARAFLRHFPQARIFSFEPTPATFQALSRFAQIQPRITPVNKALGEAPGRVAINENAFHQTNSILPANLRSEKYLGPGIINCQRKVEVEMTTLDAFCRQESVARIDLLKLDVQGFELFVLKGAQEILSTRKVGCIVLEVSFVSFYENQATPQDLITLLASHQYDLMGFYDFAHSAQNRLMWCEMMFAPHR
jgi:FkbM family methyltransferase